MTAMPHRVLDRMLSKTAAGRLTWLLGLLLALPALGVGLLHDDFVQRAVLLGRMPHRDADPTSLYRFLGAGSATTAVFVRESLTAWWASSDLSVQFFRPLSSLLLSADVWVFGDASFPAHAHSLAWGIALAVVVGALHRRVLTARASRLATLIYVLAGAHATLLAWLAARHVTVAAVFGLLAVWLHLKDREDGFGAGRVLSPLALFVGLAAGETALAGAIVIGCYEAFGRDDRRTARARALAPVAISTVAYLAMYVALGYGARGSGAYVSPTDLGRFALAVLTRTPALVAEQAGAFPSVAWGPFPALRVVLALAGVGFALLLGWLLCARWNALDAKDRGAVRWLAPAAVLSVIPFVGGFLGGRMNALPFFAGSVVLAVAIDGVRAADTGRARRAAVNVLLVLHLGLSPLVRLGVTSTLLQASTIEASFVSDAEIDCPVGGHVILLPSADPSVSMFAAATFLLAEPDRFSTWAALSFAPQPHELAWVDPSTFELATVGPRQVNEFEVLFRDVRDALPTGAVVEAKAFRAEVLAVESGVPSRVSFRLPRPLDAPDTCFVEWRDGALRSMAAPEMGERIELPHRLGPLGM